MDLTVPKVRAPTFASNNTKSSYVSLINFCQSIYKELKPTDVCISVEFSIETSTIVSSPLLGLTWNSSLWSWDTSAYLPPMGNFFVSKLLCVGYPDISKIRWHLNSGYPSQEHKWCDMWLYFYKKLNDTISNFKCYNNFLNQKLSILVSFSLFKFT